MRANSELGALELAAIMGRSVSSVKAAANRHRISLRRRGVRRGLILGQPRSCSLDARIREDVVSGKVSADVICRRMEIERDAATCPDCGRRPATVSRTGLCLICHNKRLAEAHLDVLEEIDSRRALWSSRQALCRARREGDS